MPLIVLPGMIVPFLLYTIKFVGVKVICPVPLLIEYISFSTLPLPAVIPDPVPLKITAIFVVSADGVALVASAFAVLLVVATFENTAFSGVSFTVSSKPYTGWEFVSTIETATVVGGVTVASSG